MAARRSELEAQEPVRERSSAYVAHETAIIEPGAMIGDGTVIWHFAHVRSGARIGQGCVISKGVYIDDGAVVGDGVKIQNGVSIYRGVTIEDDVLVGPHAVFTNDRFPRAFGDWDVVPTTVRRGASIGANATVVCGVQVGVSALVGAGAVVTRSVLDHELVVGNPARRIGWVCRCGRVVDRGDAPPRDLQCDRCRESGS